MAVEWLSPSCVHAVSFRATANDHRTVDDPVPRYPSFPASSSSFPPFPFLLFPLSFPFPFPFPFVLTGGEVEDRYPDERYPADATDFDRARVLMGGEGDDMEDEEEEEERA